MQKTDVAIIPEPPALAYSINGLTKVAPVGRSKVYELIRDGKLRAKRLDGRTLVLADDAKDFFNNLPDFKAA